MSSAFAIDIPINTIRRAQCGEVVAFKTIYDTFERPAYTLALRLCQCPSIAQDVLQEGMLLVFRKIGQYRFDAPFWSWLRKLFLNACLEELRRERRWGRWRRDHEQDQESVEQGGGTQNGILNDLEMGLARLPTVHRSVLWLHAVEGYSHAEIAGMLKLSEANCRAHASRARNKLKEWWHDQQPLTRDAILPNDLLNEDTGGANP